MEEIFKKSTIFFNNKKDYEDFKESCLFRSKKFSGWEIIQEYDFIKFDKEMKKENGYLFKMTFDLLKGDKKDVNKKSTSLTFSGWKKEYFEIFLNRWQYKDKPERGNWSDTELRKKYEKENKKLN